MKNKLIKKGNCLIIKGKANSGDLAKQYCTVGGSGNKTYLSVEKYVLTSDNDFAFFMKPIRSFKNKILYKSIYVIRLDSLFEIVNWINELFAKYKVNEKVSKHT